jgi:hypothetical protein
VIKISADISGGTRSKAYSRET